ncbi:MAG: hypothetical protein GX667_08910 [Xanthomonadaceae bacterium]|nr:hypothetical protein [Xanthomonadaceae bacterium]
MFNSYKRQIIIYGVILLFFIPIGIFILTEIFSQDSVYVFLKDHGSFIAGVMAIIGVLWMISTQKEETAISINSNKAMMRNEAFELKRIRAIEHYFFLKKKVRILGENFSYIEWYPVEHSKKIYEEVEIPLMYLKHFLDEDDIKEVIYLDALYVFFDFNRKENFNFKLFNSSLLSKFYILGYETGHDESGLCLLYGDDIFMETPRSLFDKRLDNEYSEEEVTRYLFGYMEHVVMDNLLRVIESKKAPAIYE